MTSFEEHRESIQAPSGQKHDSDTRTFEATTSEADAILSRVDQVLPSALEEEEALKKEIEKRLSQAINSGQVNPNIAEGLLGFYEKRRDGFLNLSDLLRDNEKTLKLIQEGVEKGCISSTESAKYKKGTLTEATTVNQSTKKNLDEVYEQMVFVNDVYGDLEKGRLNQEAATAILNKLNRNNRHELSLLLEKNWQAINTIRKLGKKGSISSQVAMELLSRTFLVQTKVGREEVAGLKKALEEVQQKTGNVNDKPKPLVNIV